MALRSKRSLAGAEAAGAAAVAVPPKEAPGGKRSLAGWVYLLPSIAIFAIFVIYPFARTIITSFFATTPAGGLTQFIGLSNFITLFTDPLYTQAIANTLIYVVLTVPLTIVIALLLAVLTAQDLPGMGIFRTIFSATMGISVAAAAVFWNLLFNANSGVLNRIIEFFGGEGVGWLIDQNFALVSVSIISIWMNLGMAYLILLGAIKSIDDSYYESVDIVGGGFWYRLRRVTVPLISPSLFFVLTVTLISAFQSFGLIDMLTQGGPNNATVLLIYRLYRDAFVNFRIGSASAQGVILFIVIFAISYIQNKLTESKVTYQ
ncbi:MULTISPECIES: carbohydrate ABC transporter permease [Collinsella]|uniref:carbohydrate ABC transporter permease n=1 Tax=Collinsella TaxID=102106 RepID=UPI000B39A84C|nr:MULTISPECIES: sugar ABC transporter permease [Collinsella]MBM6907910.1 sugar ABC transporter permease [Collinsella intestinalis]OUN46682.1 glycerol-3-phosphate ABC transporter permease [Collinsella sp. An7]